MTTEGIRVSWTSTDVRKYGVEIGTAFNVKTTTTRDYQYVQIRMIMFFAFPDANKCAQYSLRKNQNAPRTSEHPPVRGGQSMSKRLGGIIECRYKPLHGI